MNRKGFTLVELLVMMVVLGLLIGVTIPNISGIVASQKVNATKDDAVKMVDSAKILVASKNDIDKPKSGECLIFTLDYLDSSKQIVKGAYGGEYSRYDSFVIYKREGGTYNYYVRLVEKLDKGDFGVNLANINDLTSDGSKYVTQITDTTSFENSSDISAYSSDSLIQTVCPSSGSTTTVRRFNDTVQDTSPVTPTTMESDSWETIINVLKSGNTSAYPVGSMKPITIDGIGTFNVRLVNTNPCTSSVNSKTACGVVFEFADIVMKRSVNSTKTNRGGWENSELRNYLNTEFINKLPSNIANAILEVKVESGSGYDDNFNLNYITRDKLYLFSTKELLGGNDPYDRVTDTRQLDYYSMNGVKLGFQSILAKKYQGSNNRYWLRSASSMSSEDFYSVDTNGYFSTGFSYETIDNVGVAPAFKIA